MAKTVTFQLQFPREREITNDDNYFLVELKSSSESAIMIGWIDPIFDEKKFKKKLKKEVEILKVTSFGKDYNAYLKAQE